MTAKTENGKQWHAMAQRALPGVRFRFTHESGFIGMVVKLRDEGESVVFAEIIDGLPGEKTSTIRAAGFERLTAFFQSQV